MIKIMQFSNRRTTLEHDEFRAAYLGHYASYVRRFRGIRGYCLNVRANDSATTGAIVKDLERGEPQWSNDEWDGWEQFHFDNLEDYHNAPKGEPDTAGREGLMMDPSVPHLGGAMEFLFENSPTPFHVEEIIVKPVRRSESKMYKVVQFVSWNALISPEYAKCLVAGRYANAARTSTAVRGAIINVPTAVNLSNGAPIAPHETRSSPTVHWDFLCELWFQSAIEFKEAVREGPLRDALMDPNMHCISYKEVDETVGVLPNRSPAPQHHFR